MKKQILNLLALMFVATISKAQTTAMQLNGKDCNGVSHDLLADLDSGKAVILHFFMASCGSCPPPAKKIQTMANNLLKKYPSKIVAYAMPYENTTTCSYTSTWCSSNGLSLYMPYDSGAAQVAHYGGFGMPTVVLLGGADHKVLFSTLSFSTSDTTLMRNKIIALFNGTLNVSNLPLEVNSFEVFPNPTAENVTIKIDLNQTSKALIDIVDYTGKQVAIISNEVGIGSINKDFDTKSLPNGIYFIRLNLNGTFSNQKLIVNHN
jgi:hypothetical protein